MRFLFITITTLLFWVTVSCQQSNEPQNFSDLKKQYDSLLQKVTTMQDEFEIMKWGLARKGLSLEAMRQEKLIAEKVWDIPVDGSPVYGNPSAPIVIVEFSDFECPYCNRVAPELERLTQKYPNEVALVYKHFPLNFHKAAPAAHAASIAAQKQNKFWEYRYALAPYFKTLTEEVFIKIASDIGLNIEQFKKDMVLAGDNQKKIDEDMQLGQKIGVNGTPNFYVNGKKSERFSSAEIDRMVAELKK
jgi:protein-disulfide isomerase